MSLSQKSLKIGVQTYNSHNNTIKTHVIRKVCNPSPFFLPVSSSR
jgi:hypothetical protein